MIRHDLETKEDNYYISVENTSLKSFAQTYAVYICIFSYLISYIVSCCVLIVYFVCM